MVIMDYGLIYRVYFFVFVSRLYRNTGSQIFLNPPINIWKILMLKSAKTIKVMSKNLCCKHDKTSYPDGA